MFLKQIEKSKLILEKKSHPSKLDTLFVFTQYYPHRGFFFTKASQNHFKDH